MFLLYFIAIFFPCVSHTNPVCVLCYKLSLFCLVNKNKNVARNISCCIFPFSFFWWKWKIFFIFFGVVIIPFGNIERANVWIVMGWLRKKGIISMLNVDTLQQQLEMERHKVKECGRVLWKFSHSKSFKVIFLKKDRLDAPLRLLRHGEFFKKDGKFNLVSVLRRNLLWSCLKN